RDRPPDSPGAQRDIPPAFDRTDRIGLRIPSPVGSTGGPTGGRDVDRGDADQPAGADLRPRFHPSGGWSRAIFQRASLRHLCDDRGDAIDELLRDAALLRVGDAVDLLDGRLLVAA